MYTNIDPDEGMQIIEKYLNEYDKECRKHIPAKLVINMLKLVMTSNVLQFGNTWSVN